MIRRPPRSTQSRSSAASDVYKRQVADQPWVPADDEPVAGTGQADVQLLSGPLVATEPVHGEDDGRSFEPLEAEDVPVEDLVRVVEGLPVVALASGLAFDLLGVALARGQQGDVLGRPALLEKNLDLVVRLTQRLVVRAGDETHRVAVPAAVAHLHLGQGPEGLGDRERVAEVLVQEHRDERQRRTALPGEDPLALVREDVDTTTLLVAQCGQQRRPPGVREVLCLVDDDRVEELVVGQVEREAGHLGREAFFPEPAVVVRAAGSTPHLPEPVEGADVRGTLAVSYTHLRAHETDSY